MKFTVLVISLLIGASVANAVAIDVANSAATGYTFTTYTGVNPTLTFIKGTTYTLTIAASGHPFWINTQNALGTASAYSAGITGNGIATGTLTFVVPAAAPAKLYYNCQYHAAMNGVINIVEAPSAVLSVANTGFTGYTFTPGYLGVNPTISFTRGMTYQLDIAATGHPFWINIQAAKGTASAYSTGVTGNGVATGSIFFTVPASAPATLYYNCEYHAAMTGVINIVDPACAAIVSGGAGNDAFTSSCVSGTTASGSTCTLTCSATGFTGSVVKTCTAGAFSGAAAPTCTAAGSKSSASAVALSGAAFVATTALAGLLML